MKKCLNSTGRVAALLLAFIMIISMGQPAVYASEKGAGTFVFSGKAADDEQAAETVGEEAGAPQALTEQSVEASITAEPTMQGRLKAVGRNALRFLSFGNGIEPEIVLSGLLPEGAEVNAYPVSVDIPGQNVLAAYDITITVPELDENGEATGAMIEWQPDESLSVSIRDASLVHAADVEIYHMEDASAEPEVIDITTADNGVVSFDAESFSIYAIVETVLEKTISTPDGLDYKITVSYDSTSGLPEGVDLDVTEVNAEEYQTVTEEALNTENVSAVRAFDISIVDADGVKHQPTKDVQVTIELADAGELSNPSVVHIPDDKDVQPAVITPVVSGNELSFPTDGFSIYVVTSDPRQTFIFYNGSDVYAEQHVAEGGSLVRPEDPVMSGKRFRYWSRSADGTQGAVDFSTFASLSEDAIDKDNPINFYAIYEAPLTAVTYYTQDGHVCRRDEYLYKGTNITVDTKVVPYYPLQTRTDLELVFDHWTKNLATHGKINEGAGEGVLVIGQNAPAEIAVYPVLTGKRFLYFDSNRASIENSNATYVQPVGLLNGTSTSPSENQEAFVNAVLEELNSRADHGIPKAEGYVFKGWYITSSDVHDHDDPSSATGTYPVFEPVDNDDDGTFDELVACSRTVSGTTVYEYTKLLGADGNLPNNPTLHAHWDHNATTNYTVVVWRQKLDEENDSKTVMDPAADGVNREDCYSYAETFSVTNVPTSGTIPSADFWALDDIDAYNSLNSLRPGTPADIEAANNPYNGFVIREVIASHEATGAGNVANGATIHARGDKTTVLNVYYDRKPVTLRFQDTGTVYTYTRYTGTNSGTYYIPDGNGGYTEQYLYRYNNSWWKTRTGRVGRYQYSDEYIGDVYTRSSSQGLVDIAVITEPYGVNIRDYFPIKDADNQPYNNASGNTSNLARWDDISEDKLYETTIATLPTMPVHDLTFKFNSGSGKRLIYLNYLAETLPGETGDVTFGSKSYKRFIPEITIRYNFLMKHEDVDPYEGELYNYVGAVYKSSATGAATDFSADDNAALDTSGGLQTVENRHYYFCYDRETYHIMFADSRNGNQITVPNVSSNPVPYLYGAPLANYNDASYTPAAPIGYSFNGWYLDETCTTRAFFNEEDFDAYQGGAKNLIATMPAEELHLFAGWVEKKYQVTLNPNGGELTGTQQASFNVQEGETIGIGSMPDRDYLEVAAESGAYKYDETQNGGKYSAVSGDETGDYVRWNGAYVFMGWYEPPIVDSNNDGKPDDPQNPYQVDGEGNLQKDADGEYILQDDPYQFSTPCAYNVTLIARWQRGSGFFVDYDVTTNDGTGTAVAPVDGNDYVYGSQARIMALTTPPANKTLDYWQGPSMTGHTDGKYYPNDLVGIDALYAALNKPYPDSAGETHFTFTAVYRDYDPSLDPAAYTFMIPEGSGYRVYEKNIISAGETLYAPITPTASDGKVFQGWFYDSQGTRRFDGFGVINEPVYTTLYAVFSATCTVTYLMGDPATGEPVVEEDDTDPDNVKYSYTVLDVQSYGVGDPLDTRGIEHPTDANHYVTEWLEFDAEHDQPVAGSAGYAYNAVTESPVNTDLTLYAHVVPYRFLELNANGGVWGESSDQFSVQTQPIDSGAYPIRPEEPSRPGYIFDGWWTALDGGTYYDFDRALPDEVNALYAHWHMAPGTESTGYVTIVWWAQTDNRPEDDAAAKDSSDDHYQMIYSMRKQVKLGTYSKSEYESKLGLPSDWNDIAALMGRVESTSASAASFVDGTVGEGNAAQLDRYFEYSDTPVTDADDDADTVSVYQDTLTVDDSDETELHIRFFLKTYEFEFRPTKWKDGNSTATATNFDDSTALGTVYDPDGNPHANPTTDLYKIKVWLNKDISAEWPSDRAEDDRPNKAYFIWSPPSTVTGKRFVSWYYINSSGTSDSNGSTVGVSDKPRIDYAIDEGGTLIYRLYINNKNADDSFKSRIHYWAQTVQDDGTIKMSDGKPVYSELFTEQMELAAKSPEACTCDYPITAEKSLKVKPIYGYDIVTDKGGLNLNYRHNPYLPYGSAVEPRAHRYMSDDETETITYNLYRYTWADSSYADIEFYDSTGWGLFGTYGIDKLTFHWIASGEQQTGADGKVYSSDPSYYATVGSAQTRKTGGNVYYQDSNYRWHTVEWGEFCNTYITRVTQEFTEEVSTSGYANELYFYYKPHTYTLSLYTVDLEGGLYCNTLSVPYGTQLSGASGYLSQYVPESSASQTFKGWSETPYRTDSSDSYSANNGKMPASNLILYGIWGPRQYTVTVVDDNNVELWSTKVDYDTRFSEINPPAPSGSGLLFEGWEDTSTGELVKDDFRIRNDITIKAKVDYIDTWNVQFFANVPDEAVPHAGDAPEDRNSYAEGAEIAIPGGNGLSISLKTDDNETYTSPFVCWNTEADGSGDAYYPTDTYIVKAGDPNPIKLYAQYGQYRQLVLKYDKNATDATFVLASDGETAYTNTDFLKDSGKIEIVFRDLLSTNHQASDPIANSDYEAGKDLAGTPVAFTVKRDNYLFGGWALSTDKTTPVIQNGDKIRVDTLDENDNTLYAVWAVCKIVTSEGTKLYPSLAAAIADINDDKVGTNPTIEMLVAETTVDSSVTLASGKTATITTASENAADGYSYAGETGTKAVIKRADTFTSGDMITNNGTLTLTDVTLDGNKANVTAAGALINSGGTLNINSGTILQNAASSSGPAAVNVSGGSMNMTAGSITGNASDDGAVKATASGAAINFSGTPSITGNTTAGTTPTAANVCITDADTIKVTGALTSGAAVGVYAADDEADYIVSNGDFAGYSNGVTGDFSVFANDVNADSSGSPLTGEISDTTGKIRWKMSNISLVVTKIWEDSSASSGSDQSNGSSSISLTIKDGNGTALAASDFTGITQAANVSVTAGEGGNALVTLSRHSTSWTVAGEEWTVLLPTNAASAEETAVTGYIMTYGSTDGAFEDDTVNNCKTLTLTNTRAICKITVQGSDGQEFYKAYGSLEDAINAVNTDTGLASASGIQIEMLVPETVLTTGVTLTGKTATITTASENAADGYSYAGETGTKAVIKRGTGCDGDMITVANEGQTNGSLTLTNITLDGNKGNVTATGALVNSAGTLNIGSGATLQNAKSSGNGAAVVSTGSTTMSDGTISGCESTGTTGSAVYVGGGAMTMTGGSITGNKAPNGAVSAAASGAVINFSGTPSVTGNTLADGTTAANVYVDRANVINVSGPITDGTIGVYGTDAFKDIGEQFATFDTAAVTGNAIGSSLELFVNDREKIPGTDTYLTGSYGGPGIAVWGLIPITVEKTWVENPTTAIKDSGSIKLTVLKSDDNGAALIRASQTDANVTVDSSDTSKVTLSKPAAATTNTWTWTLMVPADAASVTETCDGYIKTVNANFGNSALTVDDLSIPARTILITNKRAVAKITKQGSDGREFYEVYGSLEEAFDAVNTDTGLSNAKGIQIEMLVSETSLGDQVTLSNGKTATLTTSDNALGGYEYSGSGNAVVKRGGVDDTVSMIDNSGTLTLTNITLDGEKNTHPNVSANGGIIVSRGTLTVGTGAVLQNSMTRGSGGAICSNAGTVTVSGGTITGNTAGTAGGGIYVASEGLTVTGGTISNNTVTNNGNGGAIYSASGTLDMSGGSITGNSANDGSAIHSAGATVSITGGSIKGNTPGATGAAVSGMETLNVSGTPTIYDNKVGDAQHNVKLNSDTTINVTDALDSAAKIGVYPTDTTRDTQGEQFGVYAGGVTGDFTAFWNDKTKDASDNPLRGMNGGTVGSVNRIIWSIGQVTVTKQVRGEMGDTTKDFTFTIAVNGMTNAELMAANADLAGLSQTGDAPVTFTLKGGSTGNNIAIRVPERAEVTLTETDAETYTTTVGDGTDAPAGMTDAGVTGPAEGSDSATKTMKFTVDSLSTPASLTVVNTLGEVAPTGLNLTYAPFALMLLFGAILLMITALKRKSRN